MRQLKSVGLAIEKLIFLQLLDVADLPALMRQLELHDVVLGQPNLLELFLDAVVHVDYDPAVIAQSAL